MKKTFMKGNEAIAEAAVRGGCRFFAGYPITPQNEIPEYLSDRLPEVGGAFVQAESEVASINMIYGAAAVGTLAITSSSSPGISLYSEGMSYLAGAELPAVVVSESRGGPGLGAIQPAQQDYLQATKAMGHGGFRCLVYAPSTIQEAVDLTYLACEKAAAEHCPVVILADGCTGAAMEAVTLPEMREIGDIEYVGTGGTYYGMDENHYLVTSYMPNPELQEQFNIKLKEKYERWNREEKLCEEYMVDDAEYIIAAYGVSARASRTAINNLREQGIKIGMIRPITVYPFPYDNFEKLDPEKVKKIIDVELSIPAQMIDDVRLGVKDRIPVIATGRSGGVMITNDEIEEAVLEIIG